MSLCSVHRVVRFLFVRIFVIEHGFCRNGVADGLDAACLVHNYVSTSDLLALFFLLCLLCNDTFIVLRKDAAFLLAFAASPRNATVKPSMRLAKISSSSIEDGNATPLTKRRILSHNESSSQIPRKIVLQQWHKAT